LGDKIDPAKTTFINYPKGNLKDPKAKIWPFKVHRAKQIYDTEYNHLIQPKTFGEGGYWKDFDWDKAARLGSEVVGLPYSGRYGFTETEMFWPITHMVAPKENALQCVDCHGDAPRARMDWQALGYDGDPMYHGGRRLNVENAAAAAVSGGK
ncbi:MAG: cytochrome C, partial [Calditrichia bacterium]